MPIDYEEIECISEDDDIEFGDTEHMFDPDDLNKATLSDYVASYRNHLTLFDIHKLDERHNFQLYLNALLATKKLLYALQGKQWNAEDEYLIEIARYFDNIN